VKSQSLSHVGLLDETGGLPGPVTATTSPALTGKARSSVAAEENAPWQSNRRWPGYAEASARHPDHAACHRRHEGQAMTHHQPLTPRQRRRTLALVTLRVLATATVIVALYYLLPLNHLGGMPVSVPLTVGLLLLTAAGAWQIRAVLEAKQPTIRAIEALAGYVSLLLVLFASCYYVMSRADTTSFNIQRLTRTDTLYFTLTVFSTVGFGDINATSQVARIVVMVQIVLDLVVLGLGLRVLTQAVHVGVTRRQAEQPPADSTTPSHGPDAGSSPEGS
jgi:voltage-gated potassium channel